MDYRLRVGNWRVFITDSLKILYMEEIRKEMSTFTNFQIIEKNGKPAFAVIPYDEFLKLIRDEERTIPHEVVGLVAKKGMDLIKAWRTYHGMTQAEVAKNASITQAALTLR